MKTIKIFLASSEELKDERKELADLVEHLNYTLGKQGLYIQLVKWEYLDSSMGPLHKQEEYNRELRDCELCLVLYWTRFGMYTKMELDTAYKERCAGNNPQKLYVYFKDGDGISSDLKEFRDSFPDKYGHFFCHYQNIDTLKAAFLLQFMEYQSQKLENNGAIEIRDGRVLVGGKEYVDLLKVPFAGNNEEYQNTIEEINELKEDLSELSPDSPRYAKKAERLLKLQEKLSKQEESLWDQALFITKLSSTKCSERLQRAMDLFNAGDNKGAQAVLNEEEIERDAAHNIQLIRLGEEGSLGLDTNITELELRVKTLESDMPAGWLEAVLESQIKIQEWGSILYKNDARKRSKALLQIGKTLSTIGRYSEALKYKESALDVCLSSGIVNDETVASCYNALGISYVENKRSDKGLECYINAYKIYRQLPNEKKMAVKALANVGIAYGHLKRYRAMLKYELKALEISRKHWGTMSYDMLSYCFAVGDAYYHLGEYENALEYFNVAMASIDSVYDTAAFNIKWLKAWLLDYLGNTHREIGNYQESVEFYFRCLEVRMVMYGEMHPEIAAIYHSIGKSYRGLEDYDRSLEYLLRALSVQQGLRKDNEPFTAKLYDEVAKIYACRSDFEKADQYRSLASDCHMKADEAKHMQEDKGLGFKTECQNL